MSYAGPPNHEEMTRNANYHKSGNRNFSRDQPMDPENYMKQNGKAKQQRPNTAKPGGSSKRGPRGQRAGGQKQKQQKPISVEKGQDIYVQA